MYVSNKTLATGLIGVCCSGALAGSVYLTANTEFIARWKEDTFYDSAIKDRASSTHQMLDTVRGRVETMSAGELCQTAEQCEDLYGEIVSHYIAQAGELGDRRLSRRQESEMREVLSGIDDKLENRHD